MKKYGGKHNSARSDNNMRTSMKRKTIRRMSAFFASIFIIPTIFCSHLALGYDEPGVFYKVSDTIEWLKDRTYRRKLSATPNYWGKGYMSYCIEAGADFKRDSDDWRQELGKDYRIAAKMIKTYSNNSDPISQASVAFTMHDHFDLTKDEWKKAVDNGFEDVSTDTLKKNAKNWWEEAERNTPMTLDFNQKYTSGKHAGVVRVIVRNIDGNPLKDVPIRLESENGLVKFNGGKQSVEVKSKNGAVDIPWSSSGNGSAKVKVGFLAPKAERYYSPKYQDEIRSISDAEYSEKIVFEVKNSFQPTLTSKVAKHELRVGENVDSTVTSGVREKDSWINGVSLHAQGYYFVGSAKDILQIRQRNNGESAVQYLKRIRALPNLRQVAASRAYFSRANESVNTKAKRANGDISASDLKEAEDYKVADNEAGLFGTWVWIISRDAQKKEDADKLDDEVVKVFGSADSTSVYQATISSDVVTKQKIVGIGTEIVSEITVRGLPETYGSFKGNETYGFNGDKKAHIRVWWAGEGSEKSTKKDNEKYMPGSKGEAAEQEPKEDAHHHLIGNWEVPAVNGVYKVGNGSITMRPIAGVNRSSSDPKVLKDNVHIRANKNSESGWYVFVYDFPGSSRALANKSAYNGLWSRALVEPNVLTTPVSVTTRVSDEKVKAGEKFHDNARITGTLPKGSYVVFSAYEYEEGKENKSDSSDAKKGDAKKGSNS
ncbi:peptidase, partial [Bifidobacteriaceae bacterium NR021]